MSFVSDISFIKNDAEIAATIIQMVNILSLKVLTEGVGTPGQQSFLRGKDPDGFRVIS